MPTFVPPCTLPVLFSSNTAGDGHFKLTEKWTMSRATFCNWTKTNKMAAEFSRCQPNG